MRTAHVRLAAFGGVSGLHAAAEAAAADAETVLRRLAGVYEGDVDRLYRVAFAYREADIDAARRQPGRSPRPESATRWRSPPARR